MTIGIDDLNAQLAGRYVVERKLGAGGMATVYAARDLKHHRPVAIKVLEPHLAEAVGGERFLQEIRVTANLQHPNILPLFDSGRLGTSLYYVMPHVEGPTLRDILDERSQLPADEALALAVTIARALDFAHRHQVVHRDVKPDNILLQDGQPLVADFGIALGFEAVGASRLTATGLSLGTPDYMSPEQAAGGPVDHRADQYSLGCLLYEMLAGEPPFHAATPQGVIARHLTDDLPPLTTVRPGLPEGLEAAIARATAKAPADRYPTMSAFAEELVRVSAGRPPRPRRHLRRIALAAGAAGVALAVFALATRSRTPELDRERVVVFPLVSASGADGALGEDVATMIGHALDGVGSLRWIDGWPLLDPAVRNDLRGLTADMARRVSVSRLAAHAVTGRVVSRGDSAEVFLDLVDVAGDSVVARAQAVGTTGDAWRTGLRAVNGLLPVLLGDDRPPATELLDRNPTAVAHFLVAERLFRRTRAEEARSAYLAALEADSTFALAAMRGAEAAAWDHDYSQAQRLVDTALRLPLRERDRLFAEGLDARLRGDADLALEKLEAALRHDPGFPAAWLELGETFRHLAPRRPGADSMITVAMRAAMAMDTAALGPLFHVLEVEIRHGRLAAAAPLMERFHAANPDPDLRADLDWGAWCARGELTAERLAGVRDDPQNANLAAGWLAVGGRQLPCAIDLWVAVLTRDTATDEAASGRIIYAFTGLHNALVAAGRVNGALELLDSGRVSTDAMRRTAAGGRAQVISSPPGWDREIRLRARNLLMLDDLIGIDVGGRVAAVRDEDAVEWGAGYEHAYADDLWRRAVWETHRGDPPEAESFREALRDRAPGASTRVQALIGAVSPHVALARGDTATALIELAAVRPMAPAANLGAHFAYALGLERLIEARILLSEGRHRDALGVASLLDQYPMSYLLYLAPSLQVRIAAAGELGETRMAAELRGRLDRIRGADPD